MKVGNHSSDAGTQETVVNPGKEQSHAEAEIGDFITEAFGYALDQAMQAQAAQLIADSAL
jgi:hypothetical protein